MDNEKMMKFFRDISLLVSFILMCSSLVLQAVVLESSWNSILSSCTLLFLTITLIFDGILQDGDSITIHVILYVGRLVIMNIFKF